MQNKSHTFLHAFKTSIPVLFGYLSIGFAFGFLLVKAGFHWLWAPVMCLLIFAGAAQFMAVGMLVQQKSLLEMGLAVLMINARHMVYGFSLLDRFSSFRRFKAYLIFGLTDETYGLLTTIDPPEGCDPERFDFYVTLLNHSYWTIGSTLGAVLGSIILWEAPGIEFSMTALFTVLLVEQARSLRRPGPFVLALGISILLYLLGLKEQALLLGIMASALGCFLLKKEVPHD